MTVGHGRPFAGMPVIQVGILVVGLDGGSPTSLPLHLAFALALRGLAVFPPAGLVLVIGMVLLVLHPQPLRLFDKGALVAFVQQPAEAKVVKERRGEEEGQVCQKKTHLYAASWDTARKSRCQGVVPLRVFPRTTGRVWKCFSGDSNVFLLLVNY